MHLYNFGKALFAATFDLMSVLNMISTYQAVISENNNTAESRERTMRNLKPENSTIKERVIQILWITSEENISLQAINIENKSVYPHLNDANNRDENRNDHNVPTSPV